VVVAVSMIVLWRQPPEAGQPSGMGVVWWYSLPCYLGNLVQFLNYRLDVFVIGYFTKNPAELAWYTTAVSLAQLLWLPPQAMQNTLFPTLASTTDGVRRAEVAARATRLALALTFIMALVLAIGGPWIICLLFGHRFDASMRPLRLLLPGVIPLSGAMVLTSYVAAIGKPRLNLWGSLVGLVPTVVLLFCLVPSMGIDGAAIASSVAYTATSLFILCCFCRESTMSLRTTLLLQRSDWQLVRDFVFHVLQKVR
jgi:O-antigen/teichoic acid export membrane protein